MLTTLSTVSANEPVFLAWDSQFFGCKIGRVSLTHASADILNRMLETARQQQYDLIYAFTDAESKLPLRVLRAHNGQFVDNKIVYEQLLTTPISTVSASVCLAAADDLGRLYELAYQSGEYSRFRLDPAIGEASFQRLYRQWVDNSLSGVVADAVFVWQANGTVAGFITVKKTIDTGIIGLIATDIRHWGQGIGTALVNHAKAYAAESGLNRLEVATQGRNTLACRFYEKNLFVIKSETNVYHFWL